MMNCKGNSFIDDEFDESIHQRIRIGNNSGYLDEEYEMAKDFPNLEEHHFRIQDDTQILNLEKLRRQSMPISIESNFNSSSQQFKNRLSVLLQGIDSQKATFDNHMQQQKHGFYTLADNYQDESFINNIIEKAKIEDVRLQIQQISIKDIKPTFIKKAPKANQQENQEKQIHKLSKRFNRITISQQNL